MSLTFKLPFEMVARVTSLVDRAKSGTEDERWDALDELWSLCEPDQYKEALCDSSLDLIATLLHILEFRSTDVVTLYFALGCLWFLSRNHFAKIYICKPHFRLIPNFELTTVPNLYEDSIDIIENIFSNCSMAEKNHFLIFSPEFGVVDYFKRQLSNRSLASPERPFQTFNFMLFKAKNSSLPFLMRSRAHEVILNRLFSFGNVPSQWGQFNYVVYWSLIFTMSFSSLPLGTQALKELNIGSFFLPIFGSFNTREELMAGVIYINVYGDEENHWKLSTFLVDHPSFLIMIIGLLEFTIYYQDGDDIRNKTSSVLGIELYHSIFTMRDLTCCLKNLSYHPGNCRVILKSTQSQGLFVLLNEALEDFLENNDEYGAPGNIAPSRAGGGGEDLVTIENILELLVQVSTYYQGLKIDNSDLTKEINSEVELKREHLLQFYTCYQTALLIEHLPRERNRTPEIELLVKTLQRCSFSELQRSETITI
jgi:hypothetical protein